MENEGKAELFEEIDFSDFTNTFSDLGTKDDNGGNEPDVDTDSGDNTDDDNTDSKPNGDDSGDNTDLDGDQQGADDDSAGDTSPDGDVDDDNSSSDTDDNSSPFTPYAKLLVDEGILPNLNIEEFDGTGEGLMKAMDDQISSGIEMYKDQLPEQIKKFVENYEEGVPLSTLLEIDSRREQYKAIPVEKVETDKELQKSLVHEFYKQTTRFSEEKISKLIQQADDIDELKDEAKTAHEGLVAIQDEFEADEKAKVAEQRDLEIKRNETRLTEFKETLEKTQEIIPGIKVNPNSKKRIESILTTSVAQDERGNPLNEISKYRLEHPYEYDIMLAHIYDSTKGFKDWSMLGNVGKKSAFKDLENASKRLDKPKDNKPNTTNKQTKTSKSIVDNIAKFGFNQ